MIIQTIQLTGEQIIGARFRRNGTEVTPVSGFCLPFTTEEELGETLKVQCPPVSEDIRTILILPPAMITLRELPLPFGDRRKVRAVLPLELAGETARETEALLCDAIPLDSGNWLAGWLEKSDLEPLIEQLRQADMDPEIVTVACFNWQYLFNFDHGQEQPVTAVYDDKAMLVTKNGKPFFCRHLGSSKASAAQTVATLELNHKIKISQRFCISSRSNRQLAEQEKPLPLPTALATGISSGEMQPGNLLSPYAAATAYCSGEPMFNLRTGSLAWTGRSSRLLRTFRIPLVLLTILLILLFAELGVRWRLLTTDLTALDSSISKIYKDVFPNRKKAMDESAELKAEIKRLEGSASSLHPLPFLKLLAEAKGEGISGITEIDLDESRFMLKGDAASAVDVTTFRQRLTSGTTVPDQPEITTRPNKTILFTLRGSHGGSK